MLYFTKYIVHIVQVGKDFLGNFCVFLEKFFSKIGQVSYTRISSPICWGSLLNGGRCVLYTDMVGIGIKDQNVNSKITA